MKKSLVFLTLALFTSGALSAHNAGISATPSEELPHYHEITTAQVVDLVHSTQPIFVLDARSKEYMDGKKIPGAKWVPHNAPDSAIQEAIPSKTSYVVVYCSSPKCPASKLLADRLVKMGYSNVFKYPDGLEGWIKGGNAIEQF